MSPSIKAVPFYPAEKDDDPYTSNTGTRFCIIDIDTGEILDDAQGYGYRSARNAYAAYAYKHRDKSKDKEKQERREMILSWMKEHRDFVSEMEWTAFNIAKGSLEPGLVFNEKVVRQLLDEYQLEPEFTAAELLKVWQNKI